MTDITKIPPPQFPDEAKIAEMLISMMRAASAGQSGTPSESRNAVPPNIVKGMADISTSIWKAKARMIDGATGEVRDEMKRVYRNIESALETLGSLGIELKDHTGTAFDYGLALKVVTTQETPGISRETVIETLRPTIYWNKQIIQMGEVVVGIPPVSNPSNP